MTDLSYDKPTDSEHEETLESTIVSASWKSGVAYIGNLAEVYVKTSLVGNGEEITITAFDQDGSKLDKITGILYGDEFRDWVIIPDSLDIMDSVYFEVELPGLALYVTSNMVPVLFPPELIRIGWSSKEARRKDIVTLSAELENVMDHSEATLTIYEYDDDGIHDKIVELPTRVKGGLISCEWEYDYQEDTDEIISQEEAEKYGGRSLMRIAEGEQYRS